ncbi:MAG: lamin tail domain-containing protein [Myxococcota bacterium]
MTHRRLVRARRLATLVALVPLAACGDDARPDAGGACSDLLAGDIVISEMMLNPTGADKGQEWVELFNPSDGAIDLSGAVLRSRRVDGSSERLHQITGLTVEAGGYVVLGDREADDLAEHLDYGYAEDLGSGFGNGSGEIAVGCGEAVLDSVLYSFPDYFAAEDGTPDDGASAPDNASWTFDGQRTPDALGNDTLRAWCAATSVYETLEIVEDDGTVSLDSLGTPGEANDPCFTSMPEVCTDANGSRPVVPPQPGDLVISEYMPDPATYPDVNGELDEDGELPNAPDAAGEWFELRVNASVDLNGLTVTRLGAEEPTQVVGDLECISVKAGTYVLFAKSDDPALNGGLPPVDVLTTIAMSNAPDDATGFSIGWGGQFLDTVTYTDSKTGSSTSLDAAISTPNNDELAFCEGVTEYGPGGLGTPGSENERCPVEVPEGSCLDADGETIREIVAPALGDVWINEVMPDPSALVEGDELGEWFELAASADFDLNALQLGKAGELTDDVESVDCIPVSAGDYVLLARNADTATNGGLPEAAYEFDIALNNGSDGTLLIGSRGEVLDAVAWSEGSTTGASLALDPSVSGPDANDDLANWCDGAEPYGAGDFGTPGAANTACGGTPPGTCDDGGTPRDIVFAGEGDLVITEWMPNPDAVGDTDGEWFEVLVTADVDLNGLQFGTDPTDPDDTLDATGPCISASAGERIVIARNGDMATNGGLGTVIEGSFSLTNSASTLFVGVAGTTIDSITYSSSATGASTSVVPGSESAADNDDELNHCTSGTPYGDGDLGTPGAENVCE